MTTLIRRLYQILVPAAQRDALHTAIDGLGLLDTVNATSRLGPEAEPGCGYAVTVTHYIGGPDSYEADFQTVKAMILADWPDVIIEDYRWVVDDNGVTVVVSVDGAQILKDVHSLYNYDEVWAI